MADQGRQRDLLPLPISDIEQRLAAAAPSVDGRRTTSTRRRGRLAERLSLLLGVVTSLNELNHGPGKVPSPSSTSAAQAAALGRLESAVFAMGAPPEGLTRDGAYRALLAKHGGYGETAAVRAPLDVKLLSLPRGGTSPVDLVEAGGAEGRRIVQGLYDKILPLKAALAAEDEAGLGRREPYLDPSLRNAVVYNSLLERLFDAGLITILPKGERARCPTGIFAVWKKSGKQRMILDARIGNCHFAPPDKVKLSTGSAFSCIQVDAGPPIAVGGVDIADAFYALSLPVELRTFFGLPAAHGRTMSPELRAKLGIGASEVRGPVFAAVPMGWTLALGVCQELHESIVEGCSGITDDNRFVDGRPSPDMREHPLIHTEYVDNFVSLSQAEAPARIAAVVAGAALNAAGLPTHDVEFSVGGDTLGWSFGSETPTVGVSVGTLWKIKLAIEHLLERGYCTGAELRVIVAHFTMRALMRRELLSCLYAVYHFIQVNEHRRARLWDSVARELRWCSNLLCLAKRDLGAQWCSSVLAVDASPWGRGAVLAHPAQDVIRSLGSVNERWRFSKEHEGRVLPRQNAFDYDEAAVQKDMKWQDSPFPEIPSSVWNGEWDRVESRKWNRAEAMPVLEGRVLVWSVRHIARKIGNHGMRHLIINDSLAPVLSLSKGRSSTPGMCRVCRQWASTCLTADLYAAVRWLPSERNPADNASRAKAGDAAAHGAGAGAERSNARAHIGVRSCSAAAKADLAKAVFDGGGVHRDDNGTTAASHATAASHPRGGAAAPAGLSGDARSQGRAPGTRRGEEAAVSSRVRRPAPARRTGADIPGTSSGSTGHRDGLPQPRLIVPAVGRQRPAAGRRYPAAAGCPPRVDAREVLRGRGRGRGRQTGSGADVPTGRRAAAHRNYAASGRCKTGMAPGGARPITAPTPVCSGGIHSGTTDGAPAQGSRASDDDRIHLRPAAVGGHRTAEARPRAPHRRRKRRPAEGDRARPVEPRAAPAGDVRSQRRRKRTVEDGKDRRVADSQHQLPRVRKSAAAASQASTSDVGLPLRCEVPRLGEALRERGTRHRGRDTRTAGALPAAPRRRVARGTVRDPAGGDQKEGPVALAAECRPVREGRTCGTAAVSADARRTPSRAEMRLSYWRNPHRNLPAAAAALGRGVGLELFSGTGNWAEAYRKAPGVDGSCFEWDVRHSTSSALDLTLRRNQRLVRGWIRSGYIAAVWMGTPCSSFSRARDAGRRQPGDTSGFPGPLRSDDMPTGLGGLSDNDKIKVEIGNTLAAFSASVFKLCLSLHIPCAIENPHTSRLWLHPSIRSVCKNPQALYTYTDFCAEGLPWRKRTGLLYAHVAIEEVCRKCTGKGVCSYSKLPHVQLQGALKGRFRRDRKSVV